MFPCGRAVSCRFSCCFKGGANNLTFFLSGDTCSCFIRSHQAESQTHPPKSFVFTINFKATCIVFSLFIVVHFLVIVTRCNLTCFSALPTKQYWKCSLILTLFKCQRYYVNALQWCVTNIPACYYQVHNSTVNTKAMLRPTNGVAATRTQLQGIYCT